MLFYYFTNKDLLYKEVLKANFYQMLTQLGNIIISEGKPDQKIEAFVDAYITFFKEHPDLPKLMLREIAAGGETVKQMIRELKEVIPFRMPNAIIEFVDSGIKERQFRKVDPKQTLISIIGMSLMYFLGKPLIQAALDLEDVEEQKFIEQRKASIVDLLKYGILIRSENDSH
jgi:AcrR family transcriptional regulator